MSNARRLFLSLCVACLLAALPSTPAARTSQASCAVTTGTGDVQGLDTGGSCAFLGIPYAAPPIGALRWKPPQPAAPWAVPLPATTPPSNCPQVLVPALVLPSGNEDCLKLNIWVRNPLPASPAPVIVWLHTGSFFGASANYPPHNGRRLAEETGAIVVAPNYRLGPLGFLVHSALAAEDPAHPVSGNYGLLDQRAALQWVRDNIAGFGGDPNNITLAGTSAGADSVGLHLVSPGSGGLFHRAIIESGTPTIRWPSHAESTAQGDDFATALGCVDPALVATCLRSKTRDQILLALPQTLQQPVSPPGRVHWNPVIDGLEIPDQPRLLLQMGQFHQVPTIVGFTRDEGAGFIPRTFPAGVTLAQYEAWVADEFGADGPAVLGAYPAASYPLPGDAMAQVLGDGQFVCEGRRFARSLSDARTPVFFYSYDYEIDDLFPDRVIHGVESNIIFGNNYAPPQFPSHPLNSADLRLHTAIAGYWTRFALNGHPNVDDDTVFHWPAFKDPIGDGRGSNKYIVFDSIVREGKRPREAECDFWEPFFFRSMLGKLPAWQ
jgi:para-nitrobenzyl esterase